MASPKQCSSFGTIVVGFLLMYPLSAQIGYDGQEMAYKRHHPHHGHGQRGIHTLKTGKARVLRARPYNVDQGLVHVDSGVSRIISFDYGMTPPLMGAIEMMRAEVCAAMKGEHGEKFGSYGACVKFMNKACKPGGDQEMDGGKKEKTSGLGYCAMFFPPALKDRAEEKKQAAAEKKAKAEAAAAEAAAAEAEAAAAEAEEAEAKKNADEEAGKETAGRKKAQEAASAEAVARSKAENAGDEESKKAAEAEADAAGAAKTQAEDEANAAGSRSKTEREKEKAAAVKKTSSKEKANQKGKESEQGKLETAEAEKEADEAAAEAKIAEAQEKLAAAPAPAPAPAAEAKIAHAPAPPPMGGDLLWARYMTNDKPLPDQGFKGKLIKHEDGDTQTEDWMRERTPGDDPCLICAKRPNNPWCQSKCSHVVTPQEKTVVEVIRDAVVGPSDKPVDHEFSAPEPYPKPGHLPHHGGAGGISLVRAGVIAVIALLFN